MSGLRRPGYVPSVMIPSLTISELTRLSRFPSGARKVGFITRTRGAGSNGIVDIIAAAAARMTYGRLAVGAPFVATSHN